MDFKSLKETERAMVYALENHGNQQYGSKPYVYHLTQVVGLLNDYGYGDNPLIMSAGWLHDVLEDTQVNYRRLEAEFGLPIAYTVWAMTGETVPIASGKTHKNNRMARLQSIIPKLRSSREGLIVELADRIANTKESRLNDTKLFSTYQRENLFFQECFYRPKVNTDSSDPSINAMWRKLISLNQTVET